VTPDLVLYALAAAGLAALIRALPWGPIAKSKKPISCAVCMGGHGAWVTLLAVWMAGHWHPLDVPDVVLAYFATTGLAAFVLAQTGIFTGDLFASEP
jgi:hypothetical protein